MCAQSSQAHPARPSRRWRLFRADVRHQHGRLRRHRRASSRPASRLPCWPKPSWCFADSLREALFARCSSPAATRSSANRWPPMHWPRATRSAATSCSAPPTWAPPTCTRSVLHGQTVRHRPERGYTRQTNNPALLAELTHIDVIADFRSRDIACRRPGARPLAPGLSTPRCSARPRRRRVVCNLGGISNITLLPDRGARMERRRRARLRLRPPPMPCSTPGHCAHLGKPYDEGGRFAARGRTDTALLAALLAEPYFDLPPPKSTGRDLFNPDWLETRLQAFAPGRPRGRAGHPDHAHGRHGGARDRATCARLPGRLLCAGGRRAQPGADERARRCAGRRRV